VPLERKQDSRGEKALTAYIGKNTGGGDRREGEKGVSLKSESRGREITKKR